MNTPSHAGLYIISDQFFIDFPSRNFMQNKHESRPHYYAFRDSDGIYWVIPISSKVQKYSGLITATESKHGKGSCVLYCIAKIHGADRAFLIRNMFPVTEKYILRPFTIGGVPYIVQNPSVINAVNSRAKRFLSLVKRGVMTSPVDILSIRSKLLGSE